MLGHFNFLAFIAAMVLAQTTAQHATPHCEGGDWKYMCKGLQFTLQKQNDDDFMRIDWDTQEVDFVGELPQEDTKDDIKKHMKNIAFFSPCDYEGEYASIAQEKYFQLCACRQLNGGSCNKKRLVRHKNNETETYVKCFSYSGQINLIAFNLGTS